MTSVDPVQLGISESVFETPVVMSSTRTGSFAAFYEDEYAGVLRVATALTGDRQAAEDIAGDVFADAYRRWSKISTYNQPGAWARRAVANRASNVRRRRMNWTRLISRNPFRTTEDPAPLPDEQLWNEVRQLPRRQAQVIVLHYIEQLSVTEIAEQLEISEPSAKTHLQRARETLGERLQDRKEQ